MQWSHLEAISQSINVTTFLWKTYPLTQSVFFCVFLKSICNWPLCPVHLALSFNLQAHWVSLESNQLGDFGTRMKGPRGPKCNFSFLPRLKPRWWAVGIQWRLIACRALLSQKRVIKSDTCFGKGHWCYVRAITNNQIFVVTDEFKT